jgi:hypothetical protein
MGLPSGSTTARTAAMADGQESSRADGSGPGSGTQIAVSVGGLGRRLAAGAEDRAFGDGAVTGDWLNEGEGAGEQAASRAHMRAAATSVFIMR